MAQRVFSLRSTGVRPLRLTWLAGQERIELAGSWALAALALALPFELTQRPLIQTSILVLTDLKVLFYITAALAAATLLGPMLGLVRGDVGSRTGRLREMRFALVAVLALFAISLLSTLVAADRSNALKWTLDLIPGALLAVALPFWLARDRRQALVRVGAGFLLGAAIAALIGLAEMWQGGRLDQHLLWFKSGPTVVGPYLRLSGTFEYANIAGGYFETALPVAFAAALVLFVRRRASSLQTVLVGSCTVFLLCALVLTSSRGATIGSIAGALVFATSIRRRHSIALALRRSHRLGVLFIAVSIVAVAITLAVAPAVGLRLTSQSDASWYQFGIRVGSIPTLRAGETVTVPVTVQNRSPFSWTTGGAHRFALSYHWLYPSGAMAEFEGLRTSFGSALPAGSQRALDAVVMAPAKSGRYRLAWDVVQEGVAWFGLRTGRYIESAVSVGGSRLPPAPAPKAPPGEPTVLPAAPPQPERAALWAAAVRMFAAHPLLGVGPDGFRLSYGRFTRPPQTTWDQKIFANSLPLELLADLGLAGGLAFFAFLAAVVFPLARVTLRGRASAWEAAVAAIVVAFLAHGLLDYQLGSHAMFILFWVMCGLCLTVTRQRFLPGSTICE